VVNPDSFVDPTIFEVTWGMVGVPDGQGGTRAVEGGAIVRQDRSRQPFFDFGLLKPTSHSHAYVTRCTARGA
jgi:hypothetical protein